VNETIATARRYACAQAGVVLSGVAIITRLSLIDHSIPAMRQATVTATAVSGAVGVGRALIARLDTFMDEAVPAPGWNAADQATVRVGLVPVVTGLSAVEHCVSAVWHNTVGPACVGKGV